MWIPLLCLTIALLMAAINVAALKSGEDRFTVLHNLASLSGGLGIFFMLCIPISLLYAISNYMFGPAQIQAFFSKERWRGPVHARSSHWCLASLSGTATSGEIREELIPSSEPKADAFRTS
jgi:membrane-associated PAP2 superfamily phosphatase